MIKIQVDNVSKSDRNYFEKSLYGICDKLNIYFTLDKAIIVITEPYFITEKSMENKCKTKKMIYDFLSTFRKYQFDRETLELIP